MSEDKQSPLANRVALITGGSRGIGRAACSLLASQGAAVAVHYCSKAAAAEQVASSIREAGGQAITVGADLAGSNAADDLVSRAADKLGPIDILVNNAGEMSDSPVVEMSDEVWERCLAVNLSAAFRCTRACLPGMKAKGWGRIINISTQAVYTGSANHAHYAAAKSGLLGLTFSLAKELGPLGITVNLIAPGRIRTDLLLEHLADREDEWLRQTPLKRLGEAEEVAGPIAFLASEAASYITGATLHVNGGLVMD
jgi:3-oxoacyl-[acyl-carrier protein] reductase